VMRSIRDIRASYDRLGRRKRLLANLAIWVGAACSGAAVWIADSGTFFVAFLILSSAAILTGLAIVLSEPEKPQR
jgi:hypothetical protein